jgi:hypothetical protein
MTPSQDLCGGPVNLEQMFDGVADWLKIQSKCENVL